MLQAGLDLQPLCLQCGGRGTQGYVNRLSIHHHNPTKRERENKIIPASKHCFPSGIICCRENRKTCLLSHKHNAWLHLIAWSTRTIRGDCRMEALAHALDYLQ